MSDLKSIVVIPTAWGEGVRRSIASAARQTYAPVEVVVVAAARTAQAEAMVAGLGGAVTTRVVQAAGGPGPDRNAGVAAARGSFIVCLEEGDELQPEFCEEATRALAGTGADFAIGSGLMTPGDAPLAPELPETIDARTAVSATSPWPSSA